MPGTDCSASLVTLATIVVAGPASAVVPASAAPTDDACAFLTKQDGLAGLRDMYSWYNNDHEELQVMKDTTFFSIDLRGIKNPTEPIKAAAKSIFCKAEINSRPGEQIAADSSRSS